MIYFILVSLISLIFYPAIGLKFIQKFLDYIRKGRTEFRNSESNLVLIFSTCLALQIHLWCSYILYLIGLQIHISFILSLILLSIFSRDLQGSTLYQMREKIKKLFLEGLTYQTIIFIYVILFLAISLIWKDEGLLTLWTNNYGDFPFHTALINNFSFNTHTLTDYPVYPGAKLSYYFMYDFWTACLQISPDSWKTFALINAYQWVFSWLIVYITLTSFSSGALVYLILFGGGAYKIFYMQFLSKMNGNFATELLSHRFIDAHYPWTVLLTTVWIPQRVAVFGLALFMPAICFFATAINSLVLERRKSSFVGPQMKLASSEIIVLTGIYMALMSICHFYFSLIGLLLIGLISISVAVSKSYVRFTVMRSLVTTIVFAFFCIIPSILIFHSKGGMITTMQGWMPWEMHTGSFLDPFLGSSSMWLANGVSLFILFFVLYVSASRVYVVSLIILFLMFNFIKLSSWDWDAYKIFIVLFVSTVGFLATVRRSFLFDAYCVFILCVPALMEFVVVLSETKPISIYTSNDLYHARLLRERTSDDVIMSESIHNSIVTLAGKSMYAGYSGWLASHNIDYYERFQKNEDIIKKPVCDSYPRSGIVPRYVYRSKNEGKNSINLKVEDPILEGLINIDRQCKYSEM